MSEEEVNLCVLGDTQVGKTALLYSYATDEFLQEYTPTVFDHYESEIDIGYENLAFKVDLNFVPPTVVKIEMWDVSSLEKDEMIRKYCSEKSDAFVVAFNMADRNSFDNAIEKWVPFVKNNCKARTKLVSAGLGKTSSSAQINRNTQSARKSQIATQVIKEEHSDENSDGDSDESKSKTGKGNRRKSEDSENSGSQSYLSENSKTEFKVSEEKWNIALVGTKCDLLMNEKLVNDLNKQGIFPVDVKEAENYALEIGAKFFECSALLGENVKEAFDWTIGNLIKIDEKAEEEKENVEEEDSFDQNAIPQIKSDIKLPFQRDMDKIKDKVKKVKGNDKKNNQSKAKDLKQKENAKANNKNQNEGNNDNDEKKKCAIF